MDLEEIIKALSEVLKNPSNQHYNPDQIGHILLDIENLSTKKGHSFSSDDKWKTHDLIWELIYQRILLPGANINNPNLPFVHLTKYGKRCLESEEKWLELFKKQLD